MKLKNILLFVLLILSFTACRVSAKVVFVLPLPLGAISADVESNEDFEDMASNYLNRICQIMAKETGLDFECVVIPKPTDSMLTPENIQDYIDTIEELDFSGLYISSNDYYRLLLNGYDRLRPAVSLSFFKKDYDQVCIYHRADMIINDIGDLRGLDWGGSFFYMPTRYILYKNGVDVSLKDFFGSATLVLDDSWSAMARRLIDGKVDVFTGSIEEESVGRVRNEAFRNIEKSFCTTHRSTHIIAFNKNMPEDQMKVTRKVLLGAHKDPAFQQFYFIFAAIQGHFVPFSEETFEFTREYVDTTLEKVWVKEQLDFIYPDRVEEDTNEVEDENIQIEDE